MDNMCENGIPFGIIAASLMPELVDTIMSNGRNLVPDQDEFSDENHYELITDHYNYLYSDDYIWVRKSPFVAHCRPCSPCFPNAGDLGTLTEVNGGILAYFYDPEYHDYNTFKEIMIQGNEVSLVGM